MIDLLLYGYIGILLVGLSLLSSSLQPNIQTILSSHDKKVAIQGGISNQVENTRMEMQHSLS